MPKHYSPRVHALKSALPGRSINPAAAIPPALTGIEGLATAFNEWFQLWSPYVVVHALHCFLKLARMQ